MVASVIIWFLVSFVFKMELLGGIMDRLMSVGAFGVVVLFQDEIRRFFSRLGSRHNWNVINMLKRWVAKQEKVQRGYDADIAQIVQACRGFLQCLLIHWLRSRLLSANIEW